MPERVIVAAVWLALLPVAATLWQLAPRSVHPCDGGTSALARVACSGAGAGSLRGPARLLFGGRLDLNRASERDLALLPGIGPGRAAAIVAARREARFERVDDLVRVRGIGPATLARVRSHLEVPGAARSEGRTRDPRRRLLRRVGAPAPIGPPPEGLGCRSGDDCPLYSGHRPSPDPPRARSARGSGLP